MKILIVDDNIDDRVLLRHIVERNGHEPIEAKDGKEGLEIAVHHHPDLIISDALMPVMDGFVFLKKIKEDEVLRTIPFIFYSATYQEDKDVALAKRLGARAYIFKPKDPIELWAEVEQTLFSCQQETAVSSKLLKEDEVECLEQYSEIVATKLEEKVAELENALCLCVESEREIQEQHECLQNVLDALTHPFYIINASDYTIVLANKASHLSRYKAGITCYQLTHNQSKPCTGQDHPCTIIEIKKNLGPVVLKHTHLNAEGEARTVEVHGYPIFASDGTVERVIEYCIDVTEQDELKRQLQQAQKMEAIGTLAGGIAHDFNNILTAILGYSEMVLEQLPDGSMLRMQQEQVIKAGDRAKELVRQILAFSRQDNQERIPMQIHMIVREALSLLRSSIPTTIEIITNIDTKAGMVLVDPTQIHQVVMNLCTNAYHAMRITGGTMTINLSACQIGKEELLAQTKILSPGIYVKLEVSDTGCGIDKNTLGKIFDPYFTTKKKGDGTGLGLSVVNGIVKNYGGYVSVSSALGIGSKFEVYIPSIHAVGDVTKTEQKGYPYGTENILIVDDDDSIVNLQQLMLENLGYHVRSFTDSNELLQAFKSLPGEVDLVVTDMTMPEMTGAKLSQKLMAVRPDIPVIICSGFSELIDAGKAEALGIKAYLKKPVSKRDLAETVRRVLDEKNG
nr:response regulator [Desulfobulbaceae bacterium]